MIIDIVTIFPKMFKPVINESIIKRAQGKKLVKINLYNLRDFTEDKHKKIDDRPFGGGPGMIMQVESIFNAIKFLKAKAKNKKTKPKVILLCPQGETLNQAIAKRLSRLRHIILICGHYEGVDERVRQYLVDKEISIGDYILTGGELPAMVLVDAVARLIPGVLGAKDSLTKESFSDNLLEYPQYTRPANFNKMKVPVVLLSGDHKRIEQWRQKMAQAVTHKKRPDIIKKEVS